MAGVQLQRLTQFDDRAIADLTEVGEIEFYRREFDQGIGVLMAVLKNGSRTGTVLVRRETRSNGELQCVIVAGKVRRERDVFTPGMDLIEQMAIQSGCVSMRVHTDRPGLIKNLLKRNPDAETVVEWDL